MKTVMKSMWIAIASALCLTSCLENEGLAPEEELKGDVTIGFTAKNLNTTDGMQVKWGELQDLRFITGSEAGSKLISASDLAAGTDGSSFTFSLEFPYKEAKDLNCWAIYPAGAVVDGSQTDLEAFKLQIPAKQKSLAASFDTKAEVLVSHLSDKTLSEKLELEFTRPLAVVKMTLKGLVEGEKLAEATFSNKTAALAGQFTYNLKTGKVASYGLDGKKAITLETDAVAAASGNEFYFTAFPAELEEYTVTVKTDKSTYTKTFDATSKLSLKANTLTSVVVEDMERISTETPVVTFTWDSNEILDVKGGNFEIPYTNPKPVEGAEFILVSKGGLLKDLKAENGKVTFKLDENTAFEILEDVLEWKYSLGEQVLAEGSIKVKQAAKVPDPVLGLTWEDRELSADGGSFEIAFTLQNPVDGAELAASSSKKLLKDLAVGKGKITFRLEANQKTEVLEDVLKCDYKSGDKVLATASLTIKQAAMVPEPVITIDWDSSKMLDGNGGSFSIPYSIENPVEGAALHVSSQMKILENLKAEEGNITFTLGKNTNASSRQDFLKCYYKLGEKELATASKVIKQAAKPADPILTITWDNNAELSAEGGLIKVPYTIENPIEGATIKLSTYNADDFVQNLTASNGEISFNLASNTQTEVQKYTVFVDYVFNGKDLINKQIKVKQAAGQKAADLTFTFEVLDVSHNSASVKCIPSDLASTYAFEIMEKLEYDNTDDKAIFDRNNEKWTDIWMGESIDMHIQSGAKEKTFSRLYSDKEYYIIAYGLNSDGTVTSKSISKTLVKTPLAPYFSYKGWDDSVNYPKAGGHFEVIVNITNANPSLTLTAEAESVYNFSDDNYITNASNVSVKKNNDSQYVVSYDVLENTYGKEIEVKIKLIYGSFSKKLSKYQSNL